MHVKNGNGIVGCPADAAKEILSISDFICSKNGGARAIREFVEWMSSSYGEELV